MVFLPFFRIIWYISKIISFKTKKAVSLSKNDFCILLSKDVIYRSFPFTITYSVQFQSPLSSWIYFGIISGSHSINGCRNELPMSDSQLEIPHYVSEWQSVLFYGVQALGGNPPNACTVSLILTCHSEWSETKWGISSSCHYRIVTINNWFSPGMWLRYEMLNTTVALFQTTWYFCF